MVRPRHPAVVVAATPVHRLWKVGDVARDARVSLDAPLALAEGALSLAREIPSGHDPLGAAASSPDGGDP
jgi:hypothetical protein